MRRILFLSLICLLALGGCSQSENLEPHWQTYQSDEFGISLDSPYPIRFKTLDKKYEKGAHSKKLFGTTSSPWSLVKSFWAEVVEGRKMDSFYVHVISEQSKSDAVHFVSKDLIKNFTANWTPLSNLSGMKVSPLKARLVSCSGMPATLLTQYVELPSNKNKSLRKANRLVIFVVKDQEYWQVGVYHNDQEKFGKTTQRILDSIKITPKGH